LPTRNVFEKLLLDAEIAARQHHLNFAARLISAVAGCNGQRACAG
jgi:hypothetical protein